jgi:hypothetical protein
VAPFDADALHRAARRLLARPSAMLLDGMTATMPASLHPYSLDAMQAATLACYDELTTN